jgi:hypothetical protein
MDKNVNKNENIFLFVFPTPLTTEKKCVTGKGMKSGELWELGPRCEKQFSGWRNLGMSLLSKNLLLN